MPPSSLVRALFQDAAAISVNRRRSAAPGSPSCPSRAPTGVAARARAHPDPTPLARAEGRARPREPTPGPPPRHTMEGGLPDMTGKPVLALVAATVALL